MTHHNINLLAILEGQYMATSYETIHNVTHDATGVSNNIIYNDVILQQLR